MQHALIERAHDVIVSQPRNQSRLLDEVGEHARLLRFGELGVELQHLDRDANVQREVEACVDGGETTRANRLVDAIAPVEDGACSDRRHGRRFYPE